MPVAPKPTKEEGEKVAEKIFGDFEGYLEYGTDYDEADGEGGWLPYYGLTKEFLDLPEGEGGGSSLGTLRCPLQGIYKGRLIGEKISYHSNGVEGSPAMAGPFC